MLKVSEQQIFYLLLIAAAGFFLSMASALPSGMGVAGDPGAGFLPYWISLIIILLVGYLLVTETLIQRTETARRLSRREALALGVTLAAIVAYLLLLSVAGFVPSTLLFLLLFRLVADHLITGTRPSGRTLLASALFSSAATGFIYLVFAVLFKLALP